MAETGIPHSDEAFHHPVYFRPLIPLLIAFISGIACAIQLPDLALPSLAGLLSCLAILCVAAVRRKNMRFTPLVLFFCLGAFALTPWITSSFSRDHIRHVVDDGQFWRISGTIAQEPAIQEIRTVCILDHLSLSRSDSDKSPRAAAGKLRVLVYGNPTSLKSGDRIAFASKIKAFTNFNNFGGFDYVRFMAFQNVWGNAYTSSQKMTILPLTAGGINTRLTALRKKISAQINRAVSGDSGAVLHALILGDCRGITPPLRNAFSRTGISHLLAISGLHVGIVASFSFFLFKWLLSRFNPLLHRAWTRKGAAVLSLFPVVAYGILAGMSPSTQRAVIMVCVFLLTFLVEREQDIINTICIAALIILMVHPPSLFSVAFQLSFMSVLSIIFGVSRLSWLQEKPVGKARYLIKTIITFMMVSGLAIVGTSPLTLFYFNQISVAGILSNLIFVPLIGFIVVPVGLFSVLVFMPVLLPAAHGGLFVCGLILTTCIKWIYAIGALPFAAFRTISPSVLEMTCFYGLCACILSLGFPVLKKNTPTPLLRKDSTANAPAGSKSDSGASFFSSMMDRLTPRKWAAFLLAIFIVILAADIFYWVQKRWWGNDVTITVMDVGQGNAALVELPRGRCAMIDGGGYPDNAVFDLGEKVAANFLWRRKIRTIDTVFLTHYDADHLNGMIFILKHFHVRTVFATHDPETCLKNKEFIDVLRKKQIVYPAYSQFPKQLEINGAKFTILYPPENFADRAPAESWRNSNNNSMVIQLTYGNHSMLFPGDIMEKAEKELSERHQDLQSTIMMAPHHGSGSSSTPALMDQVQPEIIIISSGRQNRFGFPSHEALARYAERHLHVLRTDTHGAVSITNDGIQLMIKTSSGEKIIF